MALAVQLVVPFALAEPQGACHVTLVTPTPSEAVPMTVMLDEEVLTVVVAGEVILIAGGVRFVVTTGAGGGADRVTVTVATTLREESAAVTVMVLLPAVSGIAATLHCVDPVAEPLEP